MRVLAAISPVRNGMKTKVSEKDYYIFEILERVLKMIDLEWEKKRDVEHQEKKEQRKRKDKQVVVIKFQEIV